MPTTFDWQQAVHDPRFWAIRYRCDGHWYLFPGVTGKAIQSYIDQHDFLNLDILEDDPLAGGYRRLSIPFPEHFTWHIDFAAEEGAALTGIYHTLSHPDL